MTDRETNHFKNEKCSLADVELQPPLNNILDENIANLRVSPSYWEDPFFDEYERSGMQSTWDFPAAESVVQDGHEVLDLGCGDGRLLLHLAKKRKLRYGVGIDISEVAINRFRNSLNSDAISNVEARFGDIFSIDPDILMRRFDAITFGDATVNYVLEDERLLLLLRQSQELLRDENSRILISIFADGTPEQLAYMDKQCTVVPFRSSDGRVSLIWWAYKFDSTRLIMHRSVFAQYDWDSEGKIQGVVCDLRDRMWTPSSIMPIATKAGLALDRVVNSKVQDGEAIGLNTAIMILKRS